MWSYTKVATGKDLQADHSLQKQRCCELCHARYTVKLLLLLGEFIYHQTNCSVEGLVKAADIKLLKSVKACAMWGGVGWGAMGWIVNIDVGTRY